MKPVDTANLNTLDLLEECLDTIHRCRKKSLTDKINRHNYQQDLVIVMKNG